MSQTLFNMKSMSELCQGQHQKYFCIFFRVLCETVRDFVAKVGRSYEDSSHSSTESQVMKEKVSIGEAKNPTSLVNVPV